MKNKVIKILDLSEKIINNEFPRFASGVDLLEICLKDLRHLAVAAYVNDETDLTNAIVESAESLDDTVYDWELREKQMNMTQATKLSYVPICICAGLKAAELTTKVTCEACELTKKVA